MADTPQPTPKDPAGTPRSAAVGSPGDLPLALTSLVGREREVSEVGGLLAAGARLLTLTGPGGTGKTRLAQAVAFEAVGGFEDGAWWVELAPISDPGAVPQAVARVLMVPEAPGRSATEAMVEDLRELEVLLVLDNCEHLIGACAGLAETLLGACPGLAVLATSREALGVRGEAIFPVPPLSVPGPARAPDVEGLAEYGAARLFVERAKAVRPGFSLTGGNAEAVARICRRLDGLPLAVELAAARIGALSAGQIAARLDDTFSLLSGRSRQDVAHHATLRATMDWSHDLLPEKEKIVFRGLSVFAGGFELEAAEAVLPGGGVGAEEVLDLLASLVDKSLVVFEERDGAARYRMLETVGRYALGKLEGAVGESERLGRRHAEYYLALAEEAEADLRGQAAWLRRLGREHDNFVSALSWALGRDAEGGQGSAAEERARLGLGLATSLAQGRFWNAYGPNEGLFWLQKGLAASGAAPDEVRAKALGHSGFLAIWQGDYERSAELLEEGMAIYKELGDKPGVATSLFHLGNMALHGQDHGRSKAVRSEAEELLGGLADLQARGLLLYVLGFAMVDEGDLDRAEEYAGEGVELNRELGDLRGMAMCLSVLGISALERGDAELAAGHYEETLRLLRRLGDKTGTAYSLRGMACVAALRGDAARAAQLWGAAEAIGESIGLPLSPFDRIHPDYGAVLETARVRLDDEKAWEAALAEGRDMTPEEAIGYALSGAQAALASKEANASPLSARETEIIALVAEGLTNGQVSQRLYLSPRTVGQHLRSVYRKLGVSSRAAAVREALERGLF